MSNRNRRKRKNKAVAVKVEDQVITDQIVAPIEDGIPTLVVPTNDTPQKEDGKTSEEVAVTESEPKVDAKETSTKDSDCGTNQKQSKKEIETEARAEDQTTENTEEKLENETVEGDSTVPADSEDISTSEASKPTDAPSKDSSEPTKNNEDSKPVGKSPMDEMPSWYKAMADTHFYARHTKATHPETGENIELHGCNAFDTHGNPVDISAKKVDKPNTKGMTEAEKAKAYSDFNFKVNERSSDIQKRRRAVYKKIVPLMPKFLADHGKVVHVWTKEKDKELNVTGLLVGLQGGRENYTVLIDGFDKKGVAKKIRRGFRYYSTTLPDGVEQVPQVPLREACEVEKEVDIKLLEDKSSKNLILPEGYVDALINYKSDRRFHTILVWNSDGRQLSFYASPVEDQEGKFKWVSLEMDMSGNYIIHNDIIRMKGSIEELLRTTVKVNQDNVGSLTVVSIPEDDSKQMELFMQVIGSGAIGEENNGEGSIEK